MGDGLTQERGGGGLTSLKEKKGEAPETKMDPISLWRRGENRYFTRERERKKKENKRRCIVT